MGGALSVPVQAPVEPSVVGWLDLGIETTKHLHRGHGPIWIQSGSTLNPYPPTYSGVDSHRLRGDLENQSSALFLQFQKTVMVYCAILVYH